MYLHGLALQHFRSYTQKTFFFPHQTTILVGENASGKTSLLEAIQLLATGESFRAEEVAEMIQFDQEIGRVKGKISHTANQQEKNDSPNPSQLEEIQLEITLTRGELQGKRTQSRLYAVNQVRRLKKNFVGQLFTVLFRPEDMRLIEGSPSRRRQFIDTVLNVTSREYATSLKTYEQALKRRNRLLPQVQERLMQPSVLTYWNSLMIKHGQVVQEQRRQFFASFATVTFPQPFTVEYQPSIINEVRINQYQEREIAAGHTLIGPHKDDFLVRLQGISIANDEHEAGSPVMLYGSRGQQRLGVLWLKMCELAFVETAVQIRPILLLDDILSELDTAHRQDVFSLLNQGQAILTTTEEKMVAEITNRATDAEVIHLNHD